MDKLPIKPMKNEKKKLQVPIYCSMLKVSYTEKSKPVFSSLGLKGSQSSKRISNYPNSVSLL